MTNNQPGNLDPAQPTVTPEVQNILPSKTNWLKRLIPFLLIAGGSAALDLFTKAYVFQRVGYDYAKDLNLYKLTLIPKVLELDAKINRGIIWGLFQNTQSRLLVIISCLAIPLIIAIYLITTRTEAKSGRGQWLITISLGLILGGAVGNLVDRICYPGVRDFIHYFYLFDWPTFNMADAFISLGAMLMVITLFWKSD